MTPQGDERIAPTAHYTAYVWARLGLPHADAFATGRGRALFWAFRVAAEWPAMLVPGVPTLSHYLELRHRCIDHALSELGPDRVVELGAGLSRRGLTLAADRGVSVIEVDLPAMVAAKRRMLEERASVAAWGRARPLLRQEARDVLAPEFGPWLAEALAGAKRPTVIAEGLLGYFPLEARGDLARAIRGALAAAGGGTFLCDLRAREGGPKVRAAAAVLRAAIRVATRGRGAREDFESTAAVERFFREAGFDHAAPVDRSRAVPHLDGIATPAQVWQATVVRGGGGG